MAGSFFDSNVLLYSVSEDAAKADRADELLAGGGWISVQVLNEVANVCRGKLKRDWERTHAVLNALQNLLSVGDLTVATHRRGLAIAQRYQLAIYDALIVAAAIECGCDRLWSEDMHHGLAIDGRLRIENPFLG